MVRVGRLVLPLLALVALAGTACAPVKSQPGKNVLAYTITDFSLSGLEDGRQPENSFRSPAANFERGIGVNGTALHRPEPGGVVLQVINAPNGGSVSFVIGGLNQLGDINNIRVRTDGTGQPVGVALILDKSNDGMFLAPLDANGKSTGFGGDAVASFIDQVGTGGEIYLDNTRNLGVNQEPCTPLCLGTNLTLANLKKGQIPGIDGFTKTVISVGTTGGGGPDIKTVVTSFQLNGVEYLP